MNRKRQKGFSLLAAIFLITVIASLSTCLVTVSGVAQQTPVLGLRSAQAYHAARSGLEWGMGHVINSAPACPGNTAFADLEGFAVNVEWTCSVHNDGSPSTPVTIYVIEATAASGTPGYADHAWRRLRGIASPAGPL